MRTNSKEIKPVHPKGISPEYSLEGLMLKLKLQYFGHLMWRTDSLGKTLMLGKTEGRRRRGQQWMKWFDGISDLMDMNLSKLQELVTGKPGLLQPMGSQRVRHDWLTELKKIKAPAWHREVDKKDHIYMALGQRGLQCRRAKIWPLQSLGFSCDEGRVRSSRNHIQTSHKTPNHDFRALNSSLQKKKKKKTEREKEKERNLKSKDVVY